MSYVVETSQPGEVIVYLARLHPVVLAPAVGLWLVGAAAAGVSPASASFFFLIAAIASLRIGIELATTEYAVTTRRLVAKHGWIRRDATEALAERIEGVRLDQSAIGRLLDYGTVVASGVGDLEVVFAGVKAPLALLTAIQEQIA